MIDCVNKNNKYINIGKKIIIVLTLLLMFPLNVFAEEDYSSGSSALSAKPSVFDSADILDSDVENGLMETAKEVKTKYNSDVVFVTVNTLSGKTATEYADDFFYKNGYGEDNNRNGLVFLVAVQDRKWAISTNGETISVFTDAGQAFIMENVSKYLKDDDFNSAYKEFASHLVPFYEKAKNGSPYDNSNLKKIKKRSFKDYAFALGTAIIPTVLIAVGLVSQMKSVKHQTMANEYIQKEKSSARVTSEVFLNTSLVRNKRRDNDSGSSTHSNSSGGISGGSSGSF